MYAYVRLCFYVRDVRIVLHHVPSSSLTSGPIGFSGRGDRGGRGGFSNDDDDDDDDDGESAAADEDAEDDDDDDDNDDDDDDNDDDDDVDSTNSSFASVTKPDSPNGKARGDELYGGVMLISSGEGSLARKDCGGSGNGENGCEGGSEVPSDGVVLLAWRVDALVGAGFVIDGLKMAVEASWLTAVASGVSDLSLGAAGALMVLRVVLTLVFASVTSVLVGLILGVALFLFFAAALDFTWLTLMHSKHCAIFPK
jgi:hypothetical protein